MRLGNRKRIANAVVLATLGCCVLSAFGDVTHYLSLHSEARSVWNGTQMPYPMGAILNMVAMSKGSMLHVSASATVVAMLLVVWVRHLVRRLDSWWVAALPITCVAAIWAGPCAMLLAWRPEGAADAAARVAWARDFADPLPSASLLVGFVAGIALIGAVLTVRSARAGKVRTTLPES